MRRAFVFGLSILGLGAAGAAAAPAEAPALKLLGDFRPGLWQMTPLDPDSRLRLPQGRTECILSAGTLLRGGADGVDATSCAYTVIEDGADRATITYVCRGSGSGRTTLRRDGDAYRVDAQGFTHRQPFELRADYRRVGSCAAGGR